MGKFSTYLKYGLGNSELSKYKGFKIFAHRIDTCFTFSERRSVVQQELGKITIQISNKRLKSYTARKILVKLLLIKNLGFGSLVGPALVTVLSKVLSSNDEKDIIYGLKCIDFTSTELDNNDFVLLFTHTLVALLSYPNDVIIRCTLQALAPVFNTDFFELILPKVTTLITSSNMGIATAATAVLVAMVKKDNDILPYPHIAGIIDTLFSSNSPTLWIKGCQLCKYVFNYLPVDLVQYALTCLLKPLKRCLNSDVDCRYSVHSFVSPFCICCLLSTLHLFIKFSDLTKYPMYEVENILFTYVNARQDMRSGGGMHKRRIANAILIECLKCIFSHHTFDIKLLVEAFVTLTGFLHVRSTTNAQFLGLKTSIQAGRFFKTLTQEYFVDETLKDVGRRVFSMVVTLLDDNRTDFTLATVGILSLVEWSCRSSFRPNFSRLFRLFGVENLNLRLLLESFTVLIEKFSESKKAFFLNILNLLSIRKLKCLDFSYDIMQRLFIFIQQNSTDKDLISFVFSCCINFLKFVGDVEQNAVFIVFALHIVAEFAHTQNNFEVMDVISGFQTTMMHESSAVTMAFLVFAKNIVGLSCCDLELCEIKAVLLPKVLDFCASTDTMIQQAAVETCAFLMLPLDVILTITSLNPPISRTMFSIDFENNEKNILSTEPMLLEGAGIGHESFTFENKND
ncbi:hypothetical protein PCE1_003643 [Barthelona sp. PCE]